VKKKKTKGVDDYLGKKHGEKKEEQQQSRNRGRGGRSFYNPELGK